MTTPIPSSVALASARADDPFAQAQVAAAAYVARYSGRTVETYGYDLRRRSEAAATRSSRDKTSALIDRVEDLSPRLPTRSR